MNKTSQLLFLLLFFFSCGKEVKPKFEPAFGQNTVETIPFSEIPPSSVLSPMKALESFSIDSAFEIVLVAHEPLINDPVDLEFDTEGNLWVVEMCGYMSTLDAEKEQEPNSRIVVLHDKDQDGFFEASTVFLDSLILPRGVLVLENSVLTIEPPFLCEYRRNGFEILEKTIIDSTFSEGGNIEHKSNNLMWGLDNWIYASKSEFKYRFRNGKWESASTFSRGQWGITQDEFGRLFYNNNSAILLGDNVLPEVLKSNPHHQILAKDLYNESKISPAVNPNRINPGVNRAYLEGTLDENGRLKNATSACGPFLNFNTSYGADFYGNAFVPEPAGNLVKRVQFTTTNERTIGIESDSFPDFLTSTDERFRPVNTTSGPDGNLYIADFYRGIIQHKTFLSKYLEEQIKVRGLDKPAGLGRIYKVVKKDATQASLIPVLNNLNSNDLLTFLGHENAWIRLEAQKLLVSRNSKETIPAIKRLLQTEENTLLKLHLLWTLEGLNALSPQDLVVSKNTSSKELKQQVLFMLRFFANEKEYKKGLKILKEWKVESDRFSKLYFLSSVAFYTPFAEAECFGIFGQYVEDFPEDDYVIDAIMSGLEDKEEAFGNYLKKNELIKIGEKWSSALELAMLNAKTKTPEKFEVPAELKASFAKGKALYKNVCESCHGNKGGGVAKIAPPLIGSEWVLQEPEKLAKIILNGMSGPVSVAGKRYEVPEVQEIMPGIRNNKNISDKDIANLMNYIRNDWGNSAKGIDSIVVTKTRKETEGNFDAYSQEVLLEETTNNFVNLFEVEKNWEKLDGKSKLEIKGNTLFAESVLMGHRTYMLSSKKYENFVLEVEAKVEAGITGGITFRTRTNYPDQENLPVGYELFLDAEYEGFGSVYERFGRGWLTRMKEQPLKMKMRKEGWNKIRLEVEEAKIRVWLNGQIVSNIEDYKYATGSVGFYISEVYSNKSRANKKIEFRNAMIQETPKSPN